MGPLHDALTTAQAFLALATLLEADGGATLGRLTRGRWELRGRALWHPGAVSRD